MNHEFQEGNCVVKRTVRRFNQVSAGQSTEWLNAIGKKSGGLVCISRVASALSRWTLSYNLRRVIASQTTSMLRLTTDDEDDEYTHNECTKGRMEKDDIGEGNIVVSLKRHGMFQDGGDTLKNLINKDVVHLRFKNLCLAQNTWDRHRLKSSWTNVCVSLQTVTIT